MEVIYPLSSRLGMWLRPSQLVCFIPVWPKWLVQGWAQNPRDPINVNPETCSRTTENEALSFCWDCTLVESKPGIINFHCLHEERPQKKRKPTQKRRRTTDDIIWAPGWILSQSLLYPSMCQLYEPIILLGLSFIAFDNLLKNFISW